jgi:hypothetical protein
MSDLTAKFAALEDQLSAQAATTDGYIDTVEAKLQALFDELDTVIINNAANTQALLAAINQSSACADCPTTPLIGTPPVDDVTSVSEDFCKRVRAFLTFIDLCCTYADSVGTVSSAFTTGFFTAVIGEIRVTMDDSGIPVPGWIDSTVIAADGVNYVINRAILGGTTHEMFDPIRSSLQGAMFLAGSVDAASSAYLAGIDSADGLAAARPLLRGFAYGDVVNYFLDPASTPNLTPYDGTGCFPGSCVTIDSDEFFEIFVDLSYEGWSVYGVDNGDCTDLWTSNVARARRWTDEPIFEVLEASTANNPPFFQTHGPGYYFGRGCANSAYSLTFCPPAE